MFSEKFAFIGHQLCLSLSYVPQQFGYEINNRSLLNGTYCTQCGELLIVFCNGNLTQNSLVGKLLENERDHLSPLVQRWPITRVHVLAD